MDFLISGHLIDGLNATHYSENQHLSQWLNNGTSSWVERETKIYLQLRL